MQRTLDAPPGSVSATVKGQLDRLTPSERRIAEVMIDTGPDLIYHSVSDIALRAECSLSSVVRCCQSLGFKGFQEFKIALSRDGRRPVRDVQHGLTAADGPMAVLTRVAEAAAEAASSGPELIDAEQFGAAVELLHRARQVLFLGVGTSAPLAQDAAYRLVTIGIQAEAPADVHMQHVKASLLAPGDVAVAVSHTGATRETVSAAKAAKEAGAEVVAVTSFARSPLVDAADLVLVAGALETAYRVEAMASRVGHMVVLDALFVAIALTDQQRADRTLVVTEDVLSSHRF
jgi:DNA-binding MurR/RpiR family transcriptional regulator